MTTVYAQPIGGRSSAVATPARRLLGGGEVFELGRGGRRVLSAARGAT